MTLGSGRELKRTGREAALFRSFNAARLRPRSRILIIITCRLHETVHKICLVRPTSCRCRSFEDQAAKLKLRSSSSRLSSASFSPLSLSFSVLARIRASYPAFISRCFLFSLSCPSSSCGLDESFQQAETSFTSASGTSSKGKDGSPGPSSVSISFFRAFFNASSSFFIVSSSVTSPSIPSC